MGVRGRSWVLLATALACVPALLLGCGSAPAREAVAAAAVAGDTARAVDLARERLRLQPDDVATRRLLVRVLGAAGRIAEAEVELNVLTARLPTSPLPLIELGHLKELAHRYDEALEAFDAASAVAPSDAIGPRTGGLRAAAWGELAWAEPRLAEAARRAPADVAVWHALGIVRLRLHDSAGARAAYLAGLRADASSAACVLGLATLAAQARDGAAALYWYDRLAELLPQAADVVLGRSFALVLLRRFDEAERALELAEARGADAAVLDRQRRWLRLQRRR